MSERFTKHFSLPQNLYAKGAPVILAAGALLTDGQTNRVLAQLKFINISPAEILSLKVEIFALDTANRPLGDGFLYQYLDLHAPTGAEFGAKTPIYLPNSATRAFHAKVAEAIFADGTIWNDNSAEWEALSPQQPLSLGDQEMERQFRIQYGQQCKFSYMKQKDLWHCPCGAINREDSCHACGLSSSALEQFDPTALKTACKKRLGKEKEEANQKIEKEKRAAAKLKKLAIIGGVALCAIFAVALVVIFYIIPSNKYDEATTLMKEGNYQEAFILFDEINYSDSDEKREEARTLFTDSLHSSISIGYNHIVALKSDGTVVATGNNDEGQCNVSDWTNIIAVATSGGIPSGNATFGIKADGTVVTTSVDFNVDNWTDITGIYANSSQVIGLKADGTVVAEDHMFNSQFDVSNWTNIVDIAMGFDYTIGLRSDGTVVATGKNDDGECNVSDWTNITDIAIGFDHTVGLRSDGTVVATGDNDDGQCDVSEWRDIVAIAADGDLTVGLKENGTVVANGLDLSYQRDVSEWSNIVTITASSNRVIGLTDNGTIITTDNNFDDTGWNDIVEIFPEYHYAIGLKDDGTVVATGDIPKGQCNVSDWTDIKIPR